ncbi:uncharacterized protein LOC131240544 isoform X2 [Magnolia sinica]|uniref:uncharacterized protein LOC131240544 isoform X2 n=1 Tax=Magnolia sinica TaxID=86752 RepID=UPI00265B26AD|nr:uncharacterized protein LOC131240544 isoform X2 [Magnolia sinica]
MEMLLQDAIYPTEQQLQLEGISSPITAQMFDFSSHDFFPETFQPSQVSSSSACCFDENSYLTDLTFPSFTSDGITKFSNNSSSGSNNNISTDDQTNNNNEENNYNYNYNEDDNLTFFLDSQQETEPDASATLTMLSVPPPLPPPHENENQQFDISTLESQIPLTDVISINGDCSEVAPPPLLLPSFEEECPPPLQSYVNLDPALAPCSVLEISGMDTFFAGNSNGISMEGSGMFPGSSILELQTQELDFQGENRSIYCSESVYSCEDIQAINEKHQQLVVSGCGSPANLTSELSTFDESAFKVKRLSVEERKEKIHRYLKKRNERNFTKKIKYACRKTLADSRPRVRGRFAKSDEFGEVSRPSYSNHEDEDDDEVGVKEEEEMLDCSEIFAHISGVNSFMCNYPIQSWM